MSYELVPSSTDLGPGSSGDSLTNLVPSLIIETNLFFDVVLALPPVEELDDHLAFERPPQLLVILSLHKRDVHGNMWLSPLSISVCINAQAKLIASMMGEKGWAVPGDIWWLVARELSKSELAGDHRVLLPNRGLVDLLCAQRKQNNCEDTCCLLGIGQRAGRSSNSLFRCLNSGTITSSLQLLPIYLVSYTLCSFSCNYQQHIRTKSGFNLHWMWIEPN